MSIYISSVILYTEDTGWRQNDFNVHASLGYNESYARKVAAVQAAQILPSGYDTFIVGGWSMGGQVA